MILLPRLNSHEVDLAFRKLKEADALPQQAREIIAGLSLMPHWNRSGGVPASDQLRNGLADRLRQEAVKRGFPHPPDQAGQQAFDRAACRVLASNEMLAKAGGDTLRNECWAGLTVLDVADLAVWRFGGSGAKLSRERLQGGNRNFLRRLWLRFRALHLGRDAEDDPWFLIDRLTEDAFVAIIERTSIGADPRLAQAIAIEWVNREKSTQDMESVTRTAVKRIRATGEVRLLSVLPDEELRVIISEAFDMALQIVKQDCVLGESGG